MCFREIKFRQNIFWIFVAFASQNSPFYFQNKNRLFQNFKNLKQGDILFVSFRVFDSLNTFFEFWFWRIDFHKIIENVIKDGSKWFILIFSNRCKKQFIYRPEKLPSVIYNWNHLVTIFHRVNRHASRPAFKNHEILGLHCSHYSHLTRMTVFDLRRLLSKKLGIL